MQNLLHMTLSSILSIFDVMGGCHFTSVWKCSKWRWFFFWPWKKFIADIVLWYLHIFIFMNFMTTLRNLCFFFFDSFIFSILFDFQKLYGKWQPCIYLNISITAWKVAKYGVISGPYFPVFGSEITPYFDSFHAVKNYRISVSLLTFLSWFHYKFWLWKNHCCFLIGNYVPEVNHKKTRFM